MGMFSIAVPTLSPESWFLLYVLLVITVTAYVLKSQRLIHPPSAEKLMEMQQEAEQLLNAIRNTPCPLCGGPMAVSHAKVGKTPQVMMRCSLCLQASIWEYRKNRWNLIAPFRKTATTVRSPTEEVVVYG